MGNKEILTEIFANNDFYSGSLRAKIKNKEITKHKKEILEIADMADALSVKTREFLSQL